MKIHSNYELLHTSEQFQELVVIRFGMKGYGRFVFD